MENHLLIDDPDKRYLKFLEKAKDFSSEYPFLDTAIYTLFILLTDGTASKKKFIYKIKYLIFPLFIFYKYYKLRNFTRHKHVPQIHDTKILAIVHGDGPQHYGELITIINELIKNDQKIIVALGSVSLKQKNYLESLKNVYLIDQIKAVYNIKIKEFLENILLSCKFLKSLLTEVENDMELLKSFQNNKGFLLDHFFICLCHFNFSKKVLENNSIKLVFSSNDGNYFSRGYFINSNLFGIENIITQHGFSTFIQTKTIANKVILWSQSDVKYYIQNRFSKERILAFGLPRFDTIREERVKEENNIEKIYNIGSKEKRICFAFPLHAFNFNVSYYKAYMEEINNVSSFLIRKGIRIFIRSHPNDDINSYQKFLSKELLSKIIIPPTSFPLIQLIKQMDVYISDFSASIIEAVICNIPTININFNNYWSKNDVTLNYAALDGCYTITSREDLLSNVERILIDNRFKTTLLQKQKKFIKNNIFNIGKATQIIAEHILLYI